MISLRVKVGIRRALGMAATGVLAASCMHGGSAWIPGSMAAAAKDQIMLVRKEPPSFGFQRLTTQTHAYSDLNSFVALHGLPDFLAETGDEDRNYFVLYYLKDREAFACRSPSGNRRRIEFAGPYPITEREFRLLDDFRRDPSRTPANL